MYFCDRLHIYIFVVIVSSFVSTPAIGYVLSEYKWPQSQMGEPVFITYSYSNFFDGGLLDSSDQPVSEHILRLSVEEAFGLWASVAPLHFTEVNDIGRPVEDLHGARQPGEADIRIGHHGIDVFGGVNAHAFSPFLTDSSNSGDIHFDNLDRWELIGSLEYPDILGTAAHQIGHSLGLHHSQVVGAVMHYMTPRRQGLGTGLLTDDDVNGIRAIYGSGTGSVTPLPEPGAFSLLATLSLLFTHRSRIR